MSWYSDGERFNEHDYEWCGNCEGGDSKAQCDRCYERHTGKKVPKTWWQQQMEKMQEGAEK